MFPRGPMKILNTDLAPDIMTSTKAMPSTQSGRISIPPKKAAMDNLESTIEVFNDFYLPPSAVYYF